MHWDTDKLKGKIVAMTQKMLEIMNTIVSFTESWGKGNPDILGSAVHVTTLGWPLGHVLDEATLCRA